MPLSGICGHYHMLERLNIATIVIKLNALIVL